MRFQASATQFLKGIIHEAQKHLPQEAPRDFAEAVVEVAGLGS